MTRPELEVLRYVPREAFTPAHMEQLKRLEEYAWDGTTALDFALQVWKGESWVFELEGTESAIVLLSSSTSNGGLFVEGLAGDGIIARLDPLGRDLRVIACEYGCKRIDCTSIRGDAFAGLAQRVGFTPVSVNYSIILEDEADEQQEEDDH